jgi:hypothetical protein
LRDIRRRMTITAAPKRVALAFAITALFSASSHAEEPRGTRPSFVIRTLSDVPNRAAFAEHIWVPDIDAGFVPQGLAYSNGQLVLSAYRSTNSKQNHGPCRLFFIAPSTGAVTRRVDLPPSCGHAGGVAALADGRVVVADSRALYTVKGSRVTAITILKGKLHAAFAEADSRSLWIGSYKKSGHGTLWQFPLTILGKAAIDESHAVARHTIPARVQGLALDHSGGMWLTVSGSRDGTLLKFDPVHNRVIARYAMPAGIDDLAVDGRGRIWAVSEAGSIRWSKWPTNYPLLFAIDPARLQ